MASLKDLRRRIRSTKSTQQITKAMEMVSAAKLRRAQARAVAARPYAAKLTEMLARLAGAASEIESPLFRAREAKVTALVLVTADGGLAGAYNANLLRAAELRLRAAAPGTVKLVLVGRKGREYFKRRRYPVLATHADLPPEANLDFAKKLTQDLIELFLSGAVDRVEVVYTHYISALNRRIVTEVFLPVGGSGAAGDAATPPPQDRGTIFEPNPEAIFEQLLLRYAGAKMFAALADALAAEHSARMVAMGAARKNAGELVDSLTLLRNRMRQAAITKEIAEIVGGAEALK